MAKKVAMEEARMAPGMCALAMGSVEDLAGLSWRGEMKADENTSKAEEKTTEADDKTTKFQDKTFEESFATREEEDPSRGLESMHLSTAPRLSRMLRSSRSCWRSSGEIVGTI